MAAPNIVNVSTITAKTAYLTPGTTGATILIANAASSGKVFKINMVVAANINSSATINATVAINSNASASGTSYPLSSTVSVPSSSSLIVSDKGTAFYLEEDRALVVTSSIASNMTFTTSYEEIS